MGVRDFTTFMVYWPTLVMPLLTVQNNIFVARKRQDCTALMLFALSVVFDTINHQILLDIWSNPIKLMFGVSMCLDHSCFNMYTTSLSSVLPKTNDIKHHICTTYTQVHNASSLNNSIAHLSQSKTGCTQTS